MFHHQTLNIIYADPRYVADKHATAAKLAAVTGGDVANYETRLNKGIEYTVVADRVPNVVELSAITGHRDLNMLKRYYHPNAERLAVKLG